MERDYENCYRNFAVRGGTNRVREAWALQKIDRYSNEDREPESRIENAKDIVEYVAWYYYINNLRKSD